MSKKFNWGDFKKLDNMETVIYPKKMVEKKPRRIESLMYWLYSHKIFVFSVSFLIGSMIGHFTFAEVVYTRDPSGYTITSPITVNVSDVDFDVICPGGSGLGLDYWLIIVSGGYEFTGPVHHKTVTSTSDIFVLPATDEENMYQGITFMCSNEDATDIQGIGSSNIIEVPLEGQEYIFVVEENSSIGVFGGLGDTFIPATTNSAKESSSGMLRLIGGIAGIALSIGFGTALLEFLKEGVDHDNKMKELYKEAEKQHDILYKKGKK